MGFFDKLKAAVGVGQPTIDISLSSTTITDDQLINAYITVTAQDTTAEIDELKIEFIRKMKITRKVIENGNETTVTEEKEAVLYRIINKGNYYSKHFENVYDPENGEMKTQERESNAPDINTKIVIEANQKYDAQFQFCIDVFNVDKANMQQLALMDATVESTFFIKVSADMQGLDPNKEIEVNYTRTF